MVCSHPSGGPMAGQGALHQRLLQNEAFPVAPLSSEPVCCFFECAFSSFMRDELGQERLPLYIWSDSSPQGGHNWSLAQLHRLDTKSLSELQAIGHAVTTLASHDLPPVPESHDLESDSDDASPSRAASTPPAASPASPPAAMSLAACQDTPSQSSQLSWSEAKRLTRLL